MDYSEMKKAQLIEEIEALQEKMAELERAQEEELRKYRDHLEKLVEERTAELRATNESLQREIGERKWAENELRKLKTISDKAGYGITIVDLEGNVSYVNTSFARMHGYTSDELIGKHLSIFHTEQQMANVNRLIEQLNREGSYVAEEVWHKRNDNTEFPTLMSGTLVKDENGTPLFMAGTAVDITERKRAEEALRHSLEETARGQRTLLALSQAAQAVQRARTPEEVYQTIGDEVTRLGYQAAIFTLTDDRAHLAVSHITFESTLVRAAEKLTGLSAQGYRFPLVPGGFFQRIIAAGEANFIEGTSGRMVEALPEPLRPLSDRLAALLGLEQSIVAPLTVGGETHGLLVVSGTGLTEADVPAVTTFANQAAIALENARLFEQVQAGRQRLRRLTEQIVSAQEEERHRLSRELHDEAGQALTALRISLDLVREDLPMEARPLRQRLGQAIALTDTTMEELRSLAHDLRPPALDTVGLNDTLEGLCLEFAQHTKLSVDYTGAELPVLPEAVNISLYRFLQEALTNVARHAQARHVWVALDRDGEAVSLSVGDDGQGFDEQAGMAAGIGLVGMRERLELLGGQLEIESQPGQGTRLTARIPLEQEYLERRKRR
jgi:PAS domain S-box-containing protein